MEEVQLAHLILVTLHSTMATKLHTFDPDGNLLLILSARSGSRIRPLPPDLSSSLPNGSDRILKPDKDSADLEYADLPTTLETLSTEPDIHLLVSSKHMVLASPVFKATLGPNFKEGQTLRAG